MSNKEHQEGFSGITLGIVLISVGALLAAARIFGLGGAAKPTPTPLELSAKYDGTPAECLQEMIDKYHRTKAYADHGRLLLAFSRGGRRNEQSWDAAVQFVRPGRIRLQAYQALVVSDAASAEKRFFARLEDTETNNIDNQVLTRAAPEAISLNDLLSDRVLTEQLGSRLQRPPVQLELLLGEKAMATLFAEDIKLTFLAPAKIHGVICQRVQAEAPEGKYLFWIDADKLLLHKLEYPTSALLPELTQDPFVSEGSLIAEFEGATFDPKPADLDFAYTPPATAHLVKAFIPPPISSGMSMLGKGVDDFEFVYPDGRKLERETLQGKIAVLFWYAHHPLCEKPAQAFAQLTAKYQDNTDIAFLAVCTESNEIGDKAVLEQLKLWNVNLAAVRDLKEARSRVFYVRDLPSVALLDTAGKYQSLLIGQEGLTALPTALERLQKGDDLAAEVHAQEKKLRQQYVNLLAAGGVDAHASDRPHLATASRPESLKMEVAWEQKELADARGMAVLSGEKPRLFALVAEQEVWELNTAGEVLEKHTLSLPPAVSISSLRAISTEGKTYFAGFKRFSPGVYLFDEQWKLLTAYPQEITESAPVSDVQFAPFGENREPTLLIAYAESVGVHCVSLQGKREWKNRAYLPLASVNLALDDEDRGRVALLTGRGTIGTVNKYGNEDPEQKVAGWSVVQMQTALFPKPKQAGYVAISRNDLEEPCVLGLNRTFLEQWNYPLPVADFTEPLDFITSGELRTDSSGEWVIAWADGSIHIISEDGSFSDNFNTGLQIRGIAVLREGEQRRIIVSTQHGLTAWNVAEK